MIKAELERVKRLNDELYELLEKKENLYSIVTKVTPSYKSECVQESDTGSNKIESYVIALEECECKIDLKLQELEITRHEVLDYIEQVDNAIARRLLKLRYVYGYRWEKVAESIGYSLDHTKGYLHAIALKNLTQINT